jgi:hypothetical protein
MTGSLLGVVLIAMIGNGLILVHLDPFYVPVVKGQSFLPLSGYMRGFRASKMLRKGRSEVVRRRLRHVPARTIRTI